MKLPEGTSLPRPPVRRGAPTGASVRAWVWLLAILTVGALLRIAAWHHRALDPDEGAQLMDGRLVLRGLVPFVDFESRQVLYAYLMAAFIYIVGPDYARVRLFVVFADLLNTALIFALGRRLFDDRIGLLAAAAYLFFPFAGGAAPIVHTESFAVVFACAAGYCLVRYLQHPGGGLAALFAAGVLIGCGVYVRESGLAVALGTVVTLALTSGSRPRQLARQYSVLLAGLLVPCATIALAYSRLLSPAEWWRTHLNPLYLPLQQSRTVAAVLASPRLSGALEHTAGFTRFHAQAWGATWQTLTDVVVLYGPLLAGAALSIVPLLVAASKRPEGVQRSRVAGAVLYPWALALALAYGYWTVRRGFFAEYAVELVPPLSLLFAVAVVHLGRGWRLGPVPGAATLALGAAVWSLLAASHFGVFQVPRFAFLALVPLGMSWPWLAERRIGRWCLVAGILGILLMPLGLPAGLHRVLKVIAACVLVVGGWFAARAQRQRPSPLLYGGLLAVSVGLGTLDTMGRPARPRPGGAWPPSVVKEVTDTLRLRGHETDEVISGGMIWEFQAGLQPFARITHPLKLEFGLARDQAAVLAARLAANPPKFIILDGYTERTYGAVLPAFDQIVRDRYERIVTVPGGRWRVRLYELREAGQSP